jgi:hypothetical protein
MTRTRPCHPMLSRFVCMAVVLVCGCPSQATGAGRRTFENKKYGYTLQYPNSWKLQALADAFRIENFPPAKTVRAVRLPAGGASIDVMVPQQLLHQGQHIPRNIDEWTILGAAKRRVLTRHQLEISNGARGFAVTELKTECCAVPPFQESIEWYFAIDGRMFLASVVYWQGDPNVEKLEETLRQVVLSLRVNFRASAPKQSPKQSKAVQSNQGTVHAISDFAQNSESQNQGIRNQESIRNPGIRNQSGIRESRGSTRKSQSVYPTPSAA